MLIKLLYLKKQQEDTLKLLKDATLKIGTLEKHIEELNGLAKANDEKIKGQEFTLNLLNDATLKIGTLEKHIEELNGLLKAKDRKVKELTLNLKSKYEVKIIELLPDVPSKLMNELSQTLKESAEDSIKKSNSKVVEFEKKHEELKSQLKIKEKIINCNLEESKKIEKEMVVSIVK